MKSFAEIIEVMGGPTAAARKLSTSMQNCQQMRERNNIPARYWPALVAQVEGLTFEKLAKMAAERAA